MKIRNQRLSASDLQALAKFFTGRRTPPTARLSLPEAHGFMTAVVSAPSMIPTSTQHEVLFGLHDEMPAFNSMAQAQHILDLTCRLNNQIVDDLLRGDFVPLGYPSDEAVRDWCEGYLSAIQLDRTWREDDFGIGLTFPLGLLSGQFDPANLKDEKGTPVQDPTPYFTSYKEMLPDLAVEIHRYFAEQRRPITGPGRAQRAADQPKVGPNAPCPCGSGKKYKRCCGDSRGPDRDRSGT